MIGKLRLKPEIYSEFFKKLTGFTSLPFQERYAANPFSAAVLAVPTGLGKTDTVIAPWLYAHTHGFEAPRRLFIVLPRQNLTRQTAKIARERVLAAGLGDRVRVLELMGGSSNNTETLWPDELAIIVSTQDLYFSRALNRGYARREPRWPMDFALFNQDCLIVLDEIQLMNDALATSRQLDTFRKRYGIYGCAPCVWMSATVNEKWLKTVDALELPPVVRLEADDFENEVVQEKVHAVKKLLAAPLACRDAIKCAAFALERHHSGTRTLVVVNTMARAREIFRAIRKAGFLKPKLLHSRFRPDDRLRLSESLLHEDHGGQIVVATQVLEAGVDISSRLLITDAAPWGSLVQRFGRVNRKGHDKDAEIYWVDEPNLGAKLKNNFAPYEEAEVRRAIERLRTLESASPADLPLEDGPAPWQHVLRRADLIDLFDTTSDLGGNAIDVSRFIRAGEDRDIYLAWRSWDDKGVPPKDMNDIADVELCPVPIGELREFMKKHPIYSWHFATERWNKVEHDGLYAGMIAVTRCEAGGYTSEEGWSPESRQIVEARNGLMEAPESDSNDTLSHQPKAQLLREHTQQVCDEMEALIEGLTLDPTVVPMLRNAALNHDWGKAHEAFQEMMQSEDGVFLAKQSRHSVKRNPRKHFRHELASALAMVSAGEPELAAYLATCHHGKVRLGIRSMPGEQETHGKRRAHGIEDGDLLPLCEIAPGVWKQPVSLSLQAMEMGADGGSWNELTGRLLDEFGPFRLAYLEMLLRAADWKASKRHEAACTH